MPQVSFASAKLLLRQKREACSWFFYFYSFIVIISSTNKCSNLWRAVCRYKVDFPTANLPPIFAPAKFISRCRITVYSSKSAFAASNVPFTVSDFCGNNCGIVASAANERWPPDGRRVVKWRSLCSVRPPPPSVTLTTPPSPTSTEATAALVWSGSRRNEIAAPHDCLIEFTPRCGGGQGGGR